jgi:Domain of unknown function (DUF397)
MATQRGPPTPLHPPTPASPARQTNQFERTTDETFLVATDIAPDVRWIKSNRSGPAGHCVETAQVDGGVALRHSKNPDHGAFLFTRQEMTAFIQGAKDGDFDHFIDE